MKRFIPNFITSLNVFTGAVGIVWVLIYQEPELTILFVLLGAFFDLLDGLVARVLGVQSEIGKQLDSLADVVSFGVLPAVGLFMILYQSNLDFAYSPGLSWGDLIPLLIVPFSALRLAKFNVSTNQSSEFRGLPTPANALMIASFLLEPDLLTQEFIMLLTIISCSLLVSNIRMIAFKFKTWGWRGNEIRYSLLVILIGGFAVFYISFLPFVIPTYILVSFVGNYLHKSVVSSDDK